MLKKIEPGQIWCAAKSPHLNKSKWGDFAALDYRIFKLYTDAIISLSWYFVAFTTIFFESRRYEAKIQIQIGSYYAVDNDTSTTYIGRVDKIHSNGTMTMSFLRRRTGDIYNWPITPDIEDDVELSQVFTGPISLRGTIPYTIHGAITALTKFRHYKKIKQSLEEKL